MMYFYYLIHIIMSTLTIRIDSELKKQVDKLQKDVEELKDKVRQNGNGH